MSNSRDREDVVKDISKLVQEYAEIRDLARMEAEELDTDIPDPVYISGWSMMLEYETTSLAAEEASGCLVLVAEDQPRSMSRGLFEMGAGVFSG